MYKHIFDYFDENGKYEGGCEPLSETTDKPKIKHGAYSIPAYVVYIGWCDEKDKIHSGCCNKESVIRDNKTKQLIDISKPPYDYPEITLELMCDFIGVNVPQNYIDTKSHKEERFQSEYAKCINNIEYFRQNYYKNGLQNM